MRSSMLWFAILVCASRLCVGTGLSETQSDKGPPKMVRVTGCLVRGDEPGEVWLAEKNGKIYGLESPNIDLNVHLGHKVVVAGHVLSEGKEKGMEETQKQNKTGKRETADFRVLTLKVISTTCR